MRFSWLLIASACALVSACGKDAPAAPGTTQGATAAPAAPRIPQVCAGDNHTCVMRADGTVLCAGRNLDGQLGDGTTEDRPSFARVKGLADATQIDCGAHHVCARRATGQVVCWGRGAAGQIGNGATASVREPTPVQGLADGIEVTCGREFSCARRVSGQVSCWGEGGDGQLGNGATSDSPTPVPATGLTNAAEIDAGSGHACARQATGTVVCWGRNSSRQLGQGTSTQQAANPVPVAGLSAVSTIGAGGAHTCAVTPTGLSCWGETSDAQLMNGQEGSSAEDVGTPFTVPGVTGVAELALGAQSTCFRLATGEVRCAGYNNYTAKLLSTGAVERVVKTPTAVTGVGNAVALGAGYMHFCAVRQNGALVCWGSGGDGQRGDGQRTGGDIRDVVLDIAAANPAPSVPATFAPTPGVTPTVRPHLAIGDKHVCGVMNDGRVRCFGEGASGQLGNGSTADLPSNTDQYVPGITDAQWVLARNNHTCVVRANGKVACFGTPGAYHRNVLHQPTSSPVSIDALTDVESLAVGTASMCAVKRDHTVWCMGSNDSGQLGNGSREGSTTPVQVTGLTDALRVAAASSTFCAIRDGGKLSCWGYGGYGELGNGATTQSPVPVEVALTGVTYVEGSYYNFCAVHGGGKVSCWGDNDYGQIGEGTVAREPNFLVPTAVKGVRGIRHVGLGYGNACATTEAGESYCWGANAFGQTGHDATEPNPQPTPWQVLRTVDPTVATYPPYLGADCGSNYCCGLHQDGHVSCQGSTPIGGSGGFLGIGSTRALHPIAAPGVQFPAMTP